MDFFLDENGCLNSKNENLKKQFLTKIKEINEIISN